MAHTSQTYHQAIHWMLEDTVIKIQGFSENCTWQNHDNMDTGPGNRLERTTFFFLAFLLIRLFIDLLWTFNCLIEHECFLVEAHYLDAHFFNRFFQGETCFHNILFQSSLLLSISVKRVHLCLHMYTNTINKHLQANHFGHANKLPVT